MDKVNTEPLLESCVFRFRAAGVREPERTRVEGLAHVFGCNADRLKGGEAPHPRFAGQMRVILHSLEGLENGESPQDVHVYSYF